MKYIVEKREVHTVKVEIDADSPQDALDKVQSGDGTEVDNSAEYSDTIDPMGIGPDNLYQWRLFGPKLDTVIGTAASEV